MVKMNRTLMILVSGAGTTLEGLCAKIWHKHLDAKILCVIANHNGITAIDVARKWNLPYWCLDPKVYPPKEQWNSTFHDLVSVYQPGLIVLAGFDQLVAIPQKYENRIINIHPSLLPQFGGKGMYGDRVHAAVLKSKEQITGSTIHICNDKYDEGQILCQRQVPVMPGDTVEILRKRVQSTERSILPETIEQYLNVLVAKNLF